jgi:hypothetical protein
MVEIGEAVETGENVEIANIHAVSWHIVENRAGWQRWLGEYPTLSATPFVFSHLQTTLSNQGCPVSHLTGIKPPRNVVLATI